MDEQFFRGGYVRWIEFTEFGQSPEDSGTYSKLIELEMTLVPRYFIPGDLCLQFSLLRNLRVNTLAEDSS